MISKTPKRHIPIFPPNPGSQPPGADSPRAMRKRTLAGNNKGVVLLVTLAAVSILVASALALNRRARVEVASTAVIRDRLIARCMAESGVSAAMAMLIKDKKESSDDSLQEDWAKPGKIKDVLREMPFEDGEVSVSISDELARLQVNALVLFPDGREFNPDQRAVWDRLLRKVIAGQEDLEGMEPSTIINSMKDWMDSGEGDAITGLDGAESSYYQDLSPPYFCPNGPFNHIGELALVKGVNPVLLLGAGDHPGLAEFLTVHGMEDLGEDGFTFPGRINLNTAEQAVLEALMPEGSEGLGSGLDEVRQEATGGRLVQDLADSGSTEDVPGAGVVEINPKLTTTQSDFFRIRSAAELRGLQSSVTAVVQRVIDKKTGKWKCRVLQWYEE